jgi:hypothetical protein
MRHLNTDTLDFRAIQRQSLAREEKVFIIGGLVSKTGHRLSESLSDELYGSGKYKRREHGRNGMRQFDTGQAHVRGISMVSLLLAMD